MINIRGSTEIVDMAYRYKMPRIETKIEGRGNGIKTVLPNVSEVADALNRDPSEVTKFLGCELGAQTILNKADNRYIVNGAHDLRDVQELVFKYCELFVLCANCHLPETVIRIKRDDIFQKCAACGAKELVDMTHRLTTFMFKQNKAAQRENGAGSRRKKKKKDRDADAANGDEAPTPEGSSPRKERKSKKDKKKKKKKKKDRSDGDEEPEEDEAKAEGNGAAEEDNDEDDDDNDDEDDDEGSEDPVEAFQDSVNACAGFFRAWLTEHEDADAEAIIDQLTVIQMSEANVQTPDKLLIFLTALLSSTSWPAEFSAQLVMAWCVQRLEPHEEVLQKLGGSDFMKRYFIGAVEHLCAVRQPLLLPHFPLILKVALEELEVVEETDILGWAREPFNEETTPLGVSEDLHDHIIVLAQPLIEWLEAEEEDSDDEGEA